MTQNIRKKISLSFTFFILASTLVWSLNFYNNYLLTKKIELIDEKVALLNTVLEFRRYEKNYFLYFNKGDIREAISYVKDAEEKQARIIENYDTTLGRASLIKRLNDLREYKTLLSQLSGDEKPGLKIIDHQNKIRDIGKKITESIEEIVSRERRNIRGLIKQTNLLLYLALMAIFIISAVTSLFIIFNVNAPLKQIERAIRKIASGDYSFIPPITTGDIFESLVNSVNRMIEVLNRRSEQLVHSEKLASLGTLTSGVAHELNNPLNNMSTSIQILSEELEEGDVEYKRMLLSETEKQIDRARDIIKGLLEFTRDRRYVPRKVNIKSLIEKTMKLIKGELPPNLNQHFDLPENLYAMVDPSRMQQVIMNLVINAVHAMEDGEGDLSISAQKKDEDSFVIQIKDTGKGISRENLERIFDPFFTTKEVGKGTGLGLSISHGIVENHKGRIMVESKEKEGTVFTILLPVSLDSEK